MIETSVIIPTYNRLPFLKEAIESVQNQTYRDFEIIVVDDGSTDKTGQWITHLAEPIKYIYQENRGVSLARNVGINAAYGNYITFLDSDDLWQKNKLASEIDFMKSNPEALVCYTDEIWIRRRVRVNPRKRHRKYSGWIFEHCVPLCIVSPSSVLMRRKFFDIVGVFDEGLPACEDYDLWLRASLRVPFHFIPQKLIVKRGGRSDQLSSQWGLDKYRVQALLKLLEDAALNSKQRELVVSTIREKCRVLEQGFRKRGKSDEAEFYRGICERGIRLGKYGNKV